MVGFPPPFRLRTSPLELSVLIVRVIVAAAGATQVYWDFSQNPSMTGGNVPELEIWNGSSWSTPITTADVGSNMLQAVYTVTAHPNWPWRVITRPANVSFAGGYTLAVPQYGNLIGL